MSRDAVSLQQALRVARTGAVGLVEVNEPWVHGARTIVAPGPVDLEQLRQLTGVREWRGDGR